MFVHHAEMMLMSTVCVCVCVCVCVYEVDAVGDNRVSHGVVLNQNPSQCEGVHRDEFVLWIT